MIIAAVVGVPVLGYQCLFNYHAGQGVSFDLG
jgi:hypothetical protein